MIRLLGTRSIACIKRRGVQKTLYYAPANLLSTRKSYIPSSEDNLQKITTQSLIHEVAEQQKELASKVVPWFLENMPPAYFRQVPEHVRSHHVKAITAIREFMESDLSLKIESKEEDGMMQVTYINSHTKTGLLHSQINNLVVPADHELTNVQVFSSSDGELALNIFSFLNKNKVSKCASLDDAKAIFEFVEELKAGKYDNDSRCPNYCELFSEENLNEYLTRISPNYAQKSNPRRFLIQRQMYEKVRGTDGSVVHVEPHVGGKGDVSGTWVTIAAANVLPEVSLRLCSAIISGRGLDILRAHLDSVEDFENSTPELHGQVTMLRLLVSPLDGNTNICNDSEFISTLSRDLKRSKWLDNETTELGLKKFPSLGLDKAEVLTALCSMLHGPLYKLNPQAFPSIKSILQLVSSEKSYFSISESITSLFLDRFNPSNPISEDEFKNRSEAIRAKISNIQYDAAKVMLDKMLDAIENTLRTNFYNEDRYALSLRIDPNLMVSDSSKATPFGVFFVHGRHFNAFHCRFRDIARGGLRIVTPSNSDQFALESSRQFDEVYGLSYAQQLKNKDIPEGGSKAVILVNTPSISENSRFFAMRKSVKGFGDAMLDLIVKDSVEKLVDFYNKDELIYLGPDEQIIPSDIEWIVSRAAVRGYPIPAAFMSSKKDAGFNHKEYGVTSEGIFVYLDVALKRSLNIDPRTSPFTIKITGGPDGDVAGNLIKILFREYGNNCKVVGIADGFGVAEDPNGLDADELLRLVHHSLPITSFDSSKLSNEGVALSAQTDEGLIRRNTMHSRVKADAFVPAGGRPNTINADNWKQFLNADGSPSSPLIVEGANIFTTPEARKLLFKKAGVAIVKDSSANKCGVITSSYEIASSMLITKDEFMQIKPELVEDVLVRLRELARLEGELLFREYQNYPGDLPHFSERISFAIAKVTDALTDRLADVNPEDPLFQELVPLIIENLPKKLAEIGGDRVSQLPVQYQRNAIASTLASKLVYQEGIHLVEIQPQAKIADRAINYYREDRKIKKLLEDLDNSDGRIVPENKSVIYDILKRGGARTTLNIF